MAKVTHKVNRGELKAILMSPSGAVAKDMLRRGIKVQNAAKKNLERDPRRINTGTLRSSIHVTLIMVKGAPAVQIGSHLFYAIYVHDGTGIYGPRGKPIVPKTAKALRWRGKKGVIFARSVKGMRPNNFLKDALPAAKG